VFRKSGILKKEDRRTRNTKDMIKRTFMDLLQSKPMHKISVAEICRNIGINRGTFYLHYMDTRDVLDDLLSEMSEQLNEAIRQMYIKDNWLNNLNRSMYEIFQANREICLVFFENTSPSPYFMKVMEFGREKSIESWMARGKIGKKEADMIYTYISCGCYGIMRSWCLEGFPCRFDEYDRTLSVVITNGLYGFVRRLDENAKH
jgi:AcrR family transcriptional regulator